MLIRWLGVAKVSTDLMAFYILTKTGTINVQKSVWALSEDKIGDDLKEENIDPELRGSIPEASDDIFNDEDGSHNDVGDAPSPEKGTDDHTPESYDKYLTAQVLLCQGCEAKKATIVGRKRDHDGRPIGKCHANPLLDTC